MHPTVPPSGANRAATDAAERDAAACAQRDRLGDSERQPEAQAASQLAKRYKTETSWKGSPFLGRNGPDAAMLYRFLAQFTACDNANRFKKFKQYCRIAGYDYELKKTFLETLCVADDPDDDEDLGVDMHGFMVALKNIEQFQKYAKAAWAKASKSDTEIPEKFYDELRAAYENSYAIVQSNANIETFRIELAEDTTAVASKTAKLRRRVAEYGLEKMSGVNATDKTCTFVANTLPPLLER
ncbi:hypothetical protein JL721_3206 [Aureococcus anophagefferens]|nr:hypothetical protein JL721_3206 [Aureococcus anophagefferens]